MEVLGPLHRNRADRRIAYDLVWDAPVGYDPVPERIEVTFRSDGPGSAIEFIHEGVPDAASAAEHERGWRDTFETLNAYLR